MSSMQLRIGASTVGIHSVGIPTSCRSHNVFGGLPNLRERCRPLGASPASAPAPHPDRHHHHSPRTFSANLPPRLAPPAATHSCSESQLLPRGFARRAPDCACRTRCSTRARSHAIADGGAKPSPRAAPPRRQTMLARVLLPVRSHSRQPPAVRAPQARAPAKCGGGLRC